MRRKRQEFLDRQTSPSSHQSRPTQTQSSRVPKSKRVSLRAGYESDALSIAHTLCAHATTPGLAKVMCEYLKQTHQCLHSNSELPLKTTASGADHDALLNTKRGQHSLRCPPPPNSDEEDVGVTSKRLCSTNSPPPSQSQPAPFSQRDPRRHLVPETPATDGSTPATTPAPADVEMPDAPNYASVTAAPTVPTLPTMGAKAPPRPKFPPLVVETLPNWTHHFKILKEKLGRAPNARPYGRGCRFTPDEEGEYRVIQKYLTELEAHENISCSPRQAAIAQPSARARRSAGGTPANPPAASRKPLAGLDHRKGWPPQRLLTRTCPRKKHTQVTMQNRQPPRTTSGRSRAANAAQAAAVAAQRSQPSKPFVPKKYNLIPEIKNRDTALASAQSAAAPAMPTTIVPSTRDAALEALLQILMAMQKNQDPTPLFLKAAECLNRGVQYNDGA
ncbi:unnamed protein product [Pieris brassicae]|uniref:Uncharacterized protein n=1 Tax=Pieris brassicae TaxID=7116 RepID=A0A9P0X095_PIEBR|nr:unnamed protein product [Pieris brassicae]